MAKIIAIANQKGGVGKTTTAVNLGTGLARYGKRVLLIDADAQANLTECLGFEAPDELETTLSDIIEKTVNGDIISPHEGILRHQEGTELLPSNISLSGAEMSLSNVMCRETILRRYIGMVSDAYDYILIDCMPSLGVLTINALACADSVIIPAQAEYLPVKGLEQLLKVIGMVKLQMNPGLEIEGILLTMFNARTILSREIRETLTEAYGGNIRIFETQIPRSVKASETCCEGKSIYMHDPDGKVAKAYENLCREVLENE